MFSYFPKQIQIYGKTMKAVGIGKYPYDCIQKDKFPNEMIYKSESGSWIDSQSEAFKWRNAKHDVY